MSAPQRVEAPVTVTVRPAPRREPPFDDELPAGRPHLVLLAGGQQPELPFPRRVRSRPVAAAGARAEPAPAATRFGRSLIQGIVEVLNGLRPAGQLAAHVSPGVHAGLVRGAAGRRSTTGNLARFRSPGRPPVVRSVHVSEPRPGAAELSAVVDVAGRCRAIAARIELSHGQWRCVQLQFG